MMKKLLIACSLLLTTPIFAQSKSNVQIEISEEKGVERHSYYFGSVWIHSRNYVNYRVTNTGTTPLIFQSARIGGMGYSARTNCAGGLPPKARCSFTIEFAPFFEGYHFGQFLMSFDQGYEILVNVSGQAVR